MHLAYAIVLTVTIASCWCKTEESNEIRSKSASLDTNLRKALLKALTELEDEEKDKFQQNPDRTIEKASASALTIYATGPTRIEEPKVKPVVLVQKSNGLQHKPVISFVPAYLNETEQFEASASSRFTVPEGKNGFITKSSTTPGINSLSGSNEKFAKSVAAKIDLTSPSPTVASPTTEENEAKVEDVQFFTAPLVAAFTVHQDEHGLPKSVEPIYKSSTQIPVVTTSNFLETEEKLKQLRQEQFKQEQLRTQVALQEKQRVLEEQLYKLQLQQKQQQEYLLKQQRLLQEQQLKLQNHKLFEEKARLRQNEQPFVPITSPVTNQFSSQVTSNQFSSQPNQFNSVTSSHFGQPSTNQFSTQSQVNTQGNRGAVVSFQSSVSLNPVDQLNKANELPHNAQHLPVKNPVNFLQSPYVQPIYNHVRAILTPPQLSPSQHFNFAQNVDVVPQRIFRREPVVGNFVGQDVAGNRIVYSNVGVQQPVQVRLLRSNLESYQTSPGFPVQQPVINHHLNNLLYNSGIARGKQIEDLNIVSKILSYNHVGGDNFFSGSKFSDRRLIGPARRSDEAV